MQCDDKLTVLWLRTGTRDRLLETVVHATLLPLLLTAQHPRALIQLTLQLLSEPTRSSASTCTPASASYLPALPHLLHAALLALLAANLPLRSTLTAAMLGVDVTGRVVAFPSWPPQATLESLHVLAFDGEGGMVLAEGEGAFSEEEWGEVVRVAEGVCGVEKEGEMEEKEGTKERGLRAWLRGVVEEEMSRAGRWRGSL